MEYCGVGLYFQRERLDPPRVEPPLGPEDALVEIAGRDSVAAAVALGREGRLRRALPAISYTGTEFGDMTLLRRAAERLREALEPYGVEVMEAEVTGSPLWWGATVGRPNAVLSRRYGPWHICVGCHMYLHASRAPFAWSSGASRLVAGEMLQGDYEFVFVHTKHADEAAHQGDPLAKAEAIESMDRALASAGRLWEDPGLVAVVTADHSTPTTRAARVIHGGDRFPRSSMAPRSGETRWIALTRWRRHREEWDS